MSNPSGRKFKFLALLENLDFNRTNLILGSIVNTIGFRKLRIELGSKMKLYNFTVLTLLNS
jgi:hypothetical protein